jgi:hypothetical protein
MTPGKLLTMLVHPHAATPNDETTPKEILDALDWSEGDSSEDLVERAEKAEHVAASGDGK